MIADSEMMEVAGMRKTLTRVQIQAAVRAELENVSGPDVHVPLPDLLQPPARGGWAGCWNGANWTMTGTGSPEAIARLSRAAGRVQRVADLGGEQVPTSAEEIQLAIEELVRARVEPGPERDAFRAPRPTARVHPDSNGCNWTMLTYEGSSQFAAQVFAAYQIVAGRLNLQRPHLGATAKR